MDNRLDHLGEDFEKEKEAGDFDMLCIWFNFLVGWLIMRWTFWIVVIILFLLTALLIGRK